jgi:hypothetical protein
MKYLMLIYGSEAGMAQVPPDRMQAVVSAYGAFTTEVKEKKAWLAGERLSPTSTATTVRVREGKTVTTDGPFAETHEQLAGFYMLECRDLDEALDYAAKIPGAAHGSIEVRPVWS